MTNDYNNLTSPMDDMYEEDIIPTCDFYRINNDEDPCGYFAVNEENIMLQFFLQGCERENIERIFDEVIAKNNIGKALVCSNDPIFYKQCRRRATDIASHDHIFHEDEVVNIPMQFEGVIIERPNIEHLEEILSYFGNIGMTVSSDYRRRGLGSYILSSLRKQANEQGYKAICSTDNTNTASFNTIIKSGFICYHKIAEMTF